MPDIFISYRREDSSGHAGRLFDCIRERFGDESVFMDVTDISPGDDFTVALDGALASCRVVLVIIGPHWLASASRDGGRRLDDPGDHLRMEVAHALQRNARVIPVLVRGAATPAEGDLPEDLRGLAHRQAHEVSDSRWSFDTDQLIRVIEQTLGSPPRHGARDALKGVPYDRPDEERHREDEARHRGDGKPAVGDGLQTVPNVGRHRSMRLVAPVTILVVLIGLTAYMKWFGASDPHETVNPPGSGDSTNAAAAVARSRDGAPGSNVKGTAPARLPPGGEARAGPAIFKLLGGLVSREDAGTHTVRLMVRTTNVGAQAGFVISGDSFRLVVDGDAFAPEQSPIEVVSMQSAVDGIVSFRVPASAGAVALQVGEVGHNTSKIPIDLRSAGPAADKPALVWHAAADLPASFERRAGSLVFRIGSMRLEHLADAVAPLEPEKLELTIAIRLTNVGAQSGRAVGGDEFRLLVDDVPLAPTKFPIEVVSYQATIASEVKFVLPGTATNTVLQLGNVNLESVRVPLDLSAARRR
jgi:hypothetical protein